MLTEILLRRRYTRTPNWVQLGLDIDGEATGDFSGHSVSMNAAGDRVAIGANQADSNGVVDRGHVRVYSWNDTSWVQLGLDIDGEAAFDFSGHSVSMNAAGDRVAIGAVGGNDGNDNTQIDRGRVRVYSWNGDSWVKMGQDIDGDVAYGSLGECVSMNAAGDRVAIGSRYGLVQVYRWNSTAWVKLGLDIIASSGAAQFGQSMSISFNAAGDQVAIGAADANGWSGLVQVYRWNSTAWVKMGLDINGETVDDYNGHSVSMNAAGDRVIIGAPQLLNGANSNLYRTGYVRVYSWNDTSWVKMGQTINGEAPADEFGISVSMNDTGDRIAIGAQSNDGSFNRAGHVRVYSWNGDSWVKIGQDIDGEAAVDTSGWSVSLNADGDRVAIGAPGNDGNDNTQNSRGHARVYRLI